MRPRHRQRAAAFQDSAATHRQRACRSGTIEHHFRIRPDRRVRQLNTPYSGLNSKFKAGLPTLIQDSLPEARIKPPRAVFHGQHK